MPPVPSVRPPVQVKQGLSDKQLSQLAVIRQELIGLRDILQPYVQVIVP